MIRNASVALALLASIGCGGATAATRGAETESSLNIPESQWARVDVPEGGFTLEMPGTAGRRVSTRDDGQTFEYVVAREPLAFIVAVEHFGAIITPEREGVALDSVAQLFATRAVDPERGCTNGPIETITEQGHEGRVLSSTQCQGIGGGSITTAALIHGSSLLTFAVVGGNVPVGTTAALMRRLTGSIAFGAPRSWFQPIGTSVTAANVPGLTFLMPPSPQSELVEEVGASTASYTSEPIRGMAAIVNVTVPATLTATGYCAALEGNGTMELTERRDRSAGPGVATYCEVRGRHAGRPELYEIHRVSVVGGAVFEIVWVGPFLPAFVAGGDAQLEQIGASVRFP